MHQRGNLPVSFEVLIAGLKFLKDIGPERVYTRTHQLARAVFEKARRTPYLELLTPDDERMFGAMVTIRFRNGNPAKLWELCKQRRTCTLQGELVRIFTHIHTGPSDIDMFFETMREVLG